MKDPDIKVMTRTDLEDEVMLLRAQVKVLQNWRALHELNSKPAKVYLDKVYLDISCEPGLCP